MSTQDIQGDSQVTDQQRRGMLIAIICGCLVGISLTMFTSGLMLLFFYAAKINAVRMIAYLSIPLAVDGLTKMPFAYLADRIGVKRLGVAGAILEMIGFGILALSGFGQGQAIEGLIVLGICVYSLGSSMCFSGWFALLQPLVPKAIRGQFFGRLRMSWQTVALIFTGVCASYLTVDSPVYLFQVVMGIATFVLMLRIWIYSLIPDLTEPHPKGMSFKKAIDHIMHVDGFASFVAYVFLLSLFTAGAPMLFALIEKKVLGMGDNQVLWLGNLQMFGSVVGFYIGGKLVDRLGTKPVFLICHFSYSLALILFLVRGLSGDWLIGCIAAAQFFYGIVVAASSIAISTETLSLMPEENQALFSSMGNMMFRAGGAFSGMASAWMLKLGVFNDDWTLWELPMTQYDSILFCFAGMVIVLVITLGLVPSVIRKAEWIPRS
ncbi:MAG: MFS transporter [Phycisphaeraceae bacterium]|nr:MFS transporter [Phycisphaeraceae bacterium]